MHASSRRPMIGARSFAYVSIVPSSVMLTADEPMPWSARSGAPLLKASWAPTPALTKAIRNITDRLAKPLHASVRKTLRQAWELNDADKAERLIQSRRGRHRHDRGGVSQSAVVRHASENSPRSVSVGISMVRSPSGERINPCRR